MAITAKAIGALEKARALERQKKWKDAWYYYTIASREKTSEGTRGVERMLRKLEDHDIIDSSEIIRDRREANTPTEKPKIVPSISIPSEEQRTLIEDRSKLQQKPKVQQKKSNRSERKTKEQTDNKTGKEMQTDSVLAELQKKAKAGDTDAQVTLAKEFEKLKKRSEANTWWKQAADNGHPEARAKVGQWYLERALKYLGQQSILEKAGRKKSTSTESRQTGIICRTQATFPASTKQDCRSERMRRYGGNRNFRFACRESRGNNLGRRGENRQSSTAGGHPPGDCALCCLLVRNGLFAEADMR